MLFWNNVKKFIVPTRVVFFFSLENFLCIFCFSLFKFQSTLHNQLNTIQHFLVSTRRAPNFLTYESFPSLWRFLILRKSSFFLCNSENVFFTISNLIESMWWRLVSSTSRILHIEEENEKFLQMLSITNEGHWCLYGVILVNGQNYNKTYIIWVFD